MEDLISVIIPVYNCEKYIKRCVESVINQHYNNLEIILIDDGSTDGSYKECCSLKKTDSRIRLFKNKNAGVSYSRNYGIGKARGKYISFIDSDDWIDSNFYMELLKGYRSEKVDLSVVSYRKISDDKNVFCNNSNVSSFICTPEDAVKIFLDDRCFFGFCWNKLYKKEIITKMGANPFNVDYYMCEDTLFNVSYLMFCNEIFLYNGELYNYYQRKDSVTQTSSFNVKKTTGLDALNDIDSIIIRFFPTARECLSAFFLFNYYLVYITIKDNKIKKVFKQKYSRINRIHYNIFMNSKNYSLKSKLKASIRYHCAKLNNFIHIIKEKVW